jgi:sulfite reductase (ferredoxin)
MPSTYPSIYRLPESLATDLEQMRQNAAQFAAGAISAARFQSFRVPQGVYEQRESGQFMLRARLAAGIVRPEHLRVLADVAEAHGDGTLHLTSRQDIQVHGVAAGAIATALETLAAAGLSTKGGGGNTVRNVAACVHAGVCPDEAFDVTPHVVRITEHLLPDPLSFQMPRKYKLAFSGCSRDCAGATVNDLGFISRERDGQPGFAVYVGGGMGAQSAAARPLEEFVTVAETCAVAKAVQRVFDAHGNRKNRHRARLRFLIEDLGFAEFVRLYREEREKVAGTPVPELHGLPGGAGVESAQVADVGAAAVEAPGFAAWRRHNVVPQKQAGRFTVEIAPELGVIGAGSLRQLAGIVARHGEALLRATNWQTLLLRWVSEAELVALHRELAGLGLGTGQPAVLRRMVTCAGAATCRLGICLSRPLSQAIRQALAASPLDLNGPVGEVRIHISGCPNSCGRHPVGQIALSGAARRVGGRLVPHYIVQFGGHVEEGKTVLATGNLAVPARHVPAFLVELLSAFAASAEAGDFDRFLAAGGRETAAALAARYTALPESDAEAGLDTDWGAAGVFSLAGRGPAECGAGVFDLIQLDLAAAAESIAAGNWFAATVQASGALLVTRGEQAETDRQALDLFRQLFVEQGLIGAAFRPLVERAQQAAGDTAAEGAFTATATEAGGLLDAVRELYNSMGPSLRLPART